MIINQSPATKTYLKDINVGDVVDRHVAGQSLMLLKVTDLDENFIYCGPDGVGWKFDRNTGAEIDEDLGWTSVQTGSYLVEYKEQ